jgi:hypothetical protein
MRVFYRHGETLLPVLSSQTDTVPHVFHGAGDFLATEHRPASKVECVRLLFTSLPSFNADADDDRSVCAKWVFGEEGHALHMRL